MPDPGYAGGLWAGLLADVRDRMTHNRRRANARWGFLNPPPGSGHVIWIKADGERATVRLAFEIARALGERRPDRRLVVTYESEYREWLGLLRETEGTGHGFGPTDRAGVVARVLARLAPSGVVAVGDALRPALAQALGRRGLASCVVHGMPPSAATACRGFPGTGRERAAWRGRPHADAALTALIVQAQVEPVFQGVAGAHARALWWWADGAGDEDALIAAWSRSRLAAHDLLFVTHSKRARVRLSQWDRSPLPAGSIVSVDEERFWPALAASCTGVHLVNPSEPLLWTVLGGGRAVSVRSLAALDLLRPAPLPEWSDGDVLPFWEGLLEDPAHARTCADEVRRFFWNERRRAASVTESLLQEVSGW